jgi:hypothetical protein
VDAPSGEVLLRVGLDENGFPHLHFRLYDASGSRAAESEGPKSFPQGLQIFSADGELLLDVPADLDADLQYRLYNQQGRLLTCSDGATTKILPLLRMEAGGLQSPGAGARGAARGAPSAPRADRPPATSTP